MKRTRRRLALAPIVLLLVSHGAEPARRFIETGSGRGLEASVVPSLLMDRDGFLWVGSREGLFRYDGYQATAFLPDPENAGSISDVDVRRLYEARDGALWVATNAGGLNRRDPDTGVFRQFHHESTSARSLSNDSVYSVGEDAAGSVWVGTQNGLNRLDADGLGFTRFKHAPEDPASLAHDWVYVLHPGSSGQLWIGTVGGGIDRWDEERNRFEHFPLAALAGGARELNDVFAIHEAADGSVWAGTRQGLVLLDPEQGTARVVDLSGESGVQPLVTMLHADRRGRLWIATLAHGVLVVDLATGEPSRASRGIIGSPGNLPDQPLLSVTTNDHTLFVGTWGGGVFRAPLEAFESRLLEPAADGSGLRHKNVTAVLGGPDSGRPWVGSFGGGPQRVDVASGDVAPTGGRSDDPIRVSGVLSLAQSPNGARYAGTTDGLYSFAEDGSSLGLDSHAASRPDGIGRGYIGALLPQGESGLWVGSGGSGLYLRDPASGQFSARRHDPGEPNSLKGDYVTALAPGRPGHLWVGTRSDGLNHCHIEPWSCERFDGRNGGERNLANFHVTALHRDRAGGVWVATDGGGVHRVLEDAEGRVMGFQHWGTGRGLLNDGIMAIAEDDDGSLWLSTRHGLSRLDPINGRVVNQVSESGLPVSHFNTGAASVDAEYLYFGSVGGLLSIPKGTALRARPPVPVRITAIERVTAGVGAPLGPGATTAGFNVPHGDVIAIEFAVLDFAETTHEYAYRMRDTDDWTPLGQRRQVTFFGLAPGRYQFEVRGRDVFGQWNVSSPLDVQIVPSWWMTLWFRTLAVAAVALLALALHQVRLRSLRQRNAVLEQLERQRELAYAGLRQLMGRLESAKEDERGRISRELHDEFGQTLTAAKLNLQMLRRTASDPVDAQRLEDSVAMVDGMIRQARDIARALRPPLLDEAGLVPALEQHLKTLSARSGVRIELDAAPGVAAIPRGLNTTVFRVAQEAVNNALRHAAASVIRLTLRDEPGALALTIEDDGVGFDPETVGQRAMRGEHLGLLGMTERVRNAGGTIALDSSPGGGSRIRARIPYARPGSPTSAAEARE